MVWVCWDDFCTLLLVVRVELLLWLDVEPLLTTACESAPPGDTSCDRADLVRERRREVLGGWW